MTATPAGPERPCIDLLPLMAASVLLTSLVVAGLFPRLWYGLHDVSDIPLYQHYAARMAAGEAPFSESFRVEYPPLAMLLLRLPGNAGDLGAYSAGFTMWMGILALVAAALTAAAAQALWPRGRDAWIAALLFPAGAALTGAIIVNRYDIEVALVLAAILLCLARRWHVAAAALVGLGFALKFTPAALLPLVLLLSGPPRRWPPAILACGVAAIAPFLPYLASGADGIAYVFRYHLERPLQIESVLGTPMLVGQLLGAAWASFGHSHGSQSLLAPGAEFAAAASGPLTLVAVAAVYGLIWRRRSRLAADAGDATLAVFAVVIKLMSFSKVLSPQYFIWLLPAWALVAARDRTLAVLGALVLLLTQVEFPALYWRLVAMEPLPIAVVVLRNLLLLATFALAVMRLWRLPAEADNRSTTAMSASAAMPAASSHSVHAGER
jgi:hypothetical protein